MRPVAQGRAGSSVAEPLEAEVAGSAGASRIGGSSIASEGTRRLEALGERGNGSLGACGPVQGMDLDFLSSSDISIIMSLPQGQGRSFQLH